jgi:hypothetical protein
MAFAKGCNPRADYRHRERGPEVLLRVTYDMIAAAAGLQRETVRKHGTGKRRQFNPRDFASVVAYVARRMGRKL